MMKLLHAGLGQIHVTVSPDRVFFSMLYSWPWNRTLSLLTLLRKNFSGTVYQIEGIGVWWSCSSGGGFEGACRAGWTFWYCGASWDTFLLKTIALLPRHAWL
uniref:(northern house mosquito) hypothetical protein n=1 Tax=Culex pipiens TaxID=7175 RepID=A0A8D8GH85_CULPI